MHEIVKRRRYTCMNSYNMKQKLILDHLKKGEKKHDSWIQRYETAVDRPLTSSKLGQDIGLEHNEEDQRQHKPKQPAAAVTPPTTLHGRTMQARGRRRRLQATVLHKLLVSGTTINLLSIYCTVLSMLTETSSI
jgi:hypothetical protein